MKEGEQMGDRRVGNRGTKADEGVEEQQGIGGIREKKRGGGE